MVGRGKRGWTDGTMGRGKRGWIDDTVGRGKRGWTNGTRGGKWMWRTGKHRTKRATGNGKEIMTDVNWKVSGCPFRDPRTKGREPTSGAKQVAGFLGVRLGRWERKLKEKVARLRGICMQEVKVERAIRVGKC